MEPKTLFAGRYEILSQLGGGGGGLVYKALDRTTDNFVAVKVLRPHLLLDRNAHEKFELEARIAGRVKSDHLVRVFDAGRDPSTQLSFLVMEYLDGQTLEQVVAGEGPLDSLRTAEYVRQVAFGLDKVHSRKDSDGRPAPTLHRDLKPSNLMLTHRDDETPLVKILDWGIAKVLSNPGTVSLDIKGTPLYMAPEQLSQAPLTPATDVCAMGLVAFFLLTGHSYWTTGQGSEVVQAAILKEVCDGAVVPARTRMRKLGIKVDLPAAFDAWFLKCLNLDQAKRYQSAGEAARELAAALDVAIRASYPPVSSRHSQTRPTSKHLDQTQTAGLPIAAPPMSTQRQAAVHPASPKLQARIYASIVGLAIVVGLASAMAFRAHGKKTLMPTPSSAPSLAVLMALPASASVQAPTPPPLTTVTASQQAASSKSSPSSGPAPLRERKKKPQDEAETADLLSNDELRVEAARAKAEAQAKGRVGVKTEVSIALEARHGPEVSSQPH